MSNLSIILSDCDQLATVRLEVFSPADGDLYGSLDASVYVCEQHGIDTVAALWRANLTAHKATMAPGVVRACPEVYVFPTGTFGNAK
ncbi:hypothetical protein AB0H57_24475 [Micromonospora sp. NPDC050686]|uniref:hypothetical protein n=1 Tax=Micromonospora sp. NPDC050686 TaxID=3154631 RepID=UPI0033E0AE1D